MNDTLLDDTAPALSTRRELATIAGVVATALAVAGGAWYGFSQANAVQTNPRSSASAAKPVVIASTPMSIASAPSASVSAADGSTPPMGPMGVADGMAQGETVVATFFYARPPVPFDVAAALANAAAATAALLPASTAQAAAKPATAAAPPDVRPAGWGDASASLAQMWESNARAEWAVRAIPLTAPNWRISGVVQRGGETQVMVQFDGDPAMKFLKIGDALPGGGKLAWVKTDVIGVAFAKRAPVSVPVLGGPMESAPANASASAPAGKTSTAGKSRKP